MLASFSAAALACLGYPDAGVRLTAARLACSLGISWLFAVEIAIERLRLPPSAVRLGAVAALVAYGASLARPLTPADWARFAALMGAGHLLVALGPSLWERGSQLFWEYNKTLFLRFSLGALYSASIYVGLAGALASTKWLFSVGVPERLYVDLWQVVAGCFNTWFFLTGVPEQLEPRPYPPGLYRFAAYVLLPIAGLFFLIVYGYGATVVVRGDAPTEGFAGLVGAAAGLGVLAFLLLHPLEAERRWVRRASLLFYGAVVPPVALAWWELTDAVRRSGGLTEARYYAFLLLLWLLVVAAAFVVRRKVGLRAVPASLAAALALSCCGPWGASAWAMRSQLARLEGFLAEDGLLAAGALKPADHSLTHVLQIGEVFQFLKQRQTTSQWGRWVAWKGTAAEPGPEHEEARANQVWELLHPTPPPKPPPPPTEWLAYTRRSGDGAWPAVSVVGYQLWFPDIDLNERWGGEPPVLENGPWRLIYRPEGQALALLQAGAEVATWELPALLEHLHRACGPTDGRFLPCPELSFERRWHGGRAALVVAAIEGRASQGRYRWGSLRAGLLLGGPGPTKP